MFDSLTNLLAGLSRKVKDEIPDAVYQHATQSNLVDTALAAVIQQAVRGFAGDLLRQAPGGGAGGGALGSLVGSMASAFGMAEKLGVGALIQKALDSTDLDEQLRDALVDGFSRYVKDNAGRLAQVALAALRDAAKGA